MPRKSGASSGSGSKASKEEIQVAKSPAEFFAENQAIAGFDNMGKSLYTTLRELVENSLDACESVNVLPDVAVFVEELTMEQFNTERGVSVGSSASKRSSGAGAGADDNDDGGGSSAANDKSSATSKGKKARARARAKAADHPPPKDTSESRSGITDAAWPTMPYPTYSGGSSPAPSTAFGRPEASSAWGPRWH